MFDGAREHTSHADREVSGGCRCLLLFRGLSKPRLHREDHGNPAANQSSVRQKQDQQHTIRSSYSRGVMSVLQANLDRGAVLVPGEHLDMISAVQLDAESGTYSRHGQRTGHGAFNNASVSLLTATHAARHSPTRHVGVRLVLGRLGVGHDCKRSVHVI